MEDSKLHSLRTTVADGFDPLSNRTYFFDKGIYFECRQCGNCCVGDPGVVRISDLEISAGAEFLNTGLVDFKTAYLYEHNDGYAVQEHEDGRCIFYENRCRIYPVRPLQCRAFPFWMKIFRSEASFNGMKQECPGMGKGKFYSKADILDLMLIF